MNLKKKWTKQNNSVKLLLSKLKRHDTVVVAIAVVIAVVLCGGLIYLSTPVVAASAKEDLEVTQQKDNEVTIEKLDELSEYLDGLDKSISESKDSLSSFYEKDGEDKLLTEKNTKEMTNSVTEKVTGLGKDMTNLHDSISRAEQDIEKLRELIEKNEENTGKAVADSFTNIYNNLEEIENNYNKTQENTKALIKEISDALKEGDDKLSKELLDNYTELLNRLNESDRKLSDQNAESLNQFREELGSLSSQITNSLNELSANMNKEMTGINTNIDNHFNTMNLSFQGDITGLKEYLKEELSGVNGKIDEVFGRVSKGKRLLASTLLTKNVKIKEDATFEEIAKAIESIPVKIVLDRDDVPGEVVYQYHYHVDGNGNQCDVSYVPAARRGGCYTQPYVHTHTASCYTTTITYTYYTNESVEDKGFDHDDWQGKANNRYYCKHCGLEFINDSATHVETTTNKSVMQARAKGAPEEEVSRTLTCTTPAGTVLGYSKSCNMIHGQIVAAKIVFKNGYDKYNTVTPASLTTSLMMVPQNRGIASSILWDDDLGFDDSIWDLEMEDDENNSLEQKDTLAQEVEASGGKATGNEAAKSNVTEENALEGNSSEGKATEGKAPESNTPSITVPVGDEASSGDSAGNTEDSQQNTSETIDEKEDYTNDDRENNSNTDGNDDNTDNPDGDNTGGEPSIEQDDGDVTSEP